MLATNISSKGHDGMLKYFKTLQAAGGFKYTGKLDYLKRNGGGAASSCTARSTPREKSAAICKSNTAGL